MKKYDVVIIGAGAAGLIAASAALSRGRAVALFDMGDAPARKIAISGGGRCNFTNRAASRNRYFGNNPDFVQSAIAAFAPSDMLAWMDDHGLSYVEKGPGQYFCATGAADVVKTLRADVHGADIILNTLITAIEKNEDGFIVYAKSGAWIASSVIVATGGMSYPNLRVSDLGYKIAKKFGHKITQTEPGLVGLKTNAFDTVLSGLTLPVTIMINNSPLARDGASASSSVSEISDSLLFTHFGIGGPAAYRASLYGLTNDMTIDFAPGTDTCDWLKAAKTKHGKKSLSTVLALLLPAKLAKWFAGDTPKNIADYRDADLMLLAKKINRFVLPAGTYARHGFNAAEVTLGGIATDQISSKTMESKLVSGLFFVGEVLDVTGDLGGFNLHFAFASGHVAGNNA